MDSISLDQLPAVVHDTIDRQAVRDMHTHLYAPAFGTPVSNRTGKIDPAGLLLWGIDELVTYHYLVAEVFRVVPPSVLPYEQFWRMSTAQRADHIWQHLFVEHTPLSEACRGVLTTLQRLGLDPNEPTLGPYRRFFAQQEPNSYIDHVMQIANVRSITMTNAVFDDNERDRWLADAPALRADARFQSVLRIDLLLSDYPAAARQMSGWGYAVSTETDAATIEESRRFLRDWIDRLGAIYLAASLPPTFRYPAPPNHPLPRAGEMMLEQVVLPVCAERGLPLALMIGSQRAANPLLRDAGDMVGTADVNSVVNLCAAHPRNKFLVTMLARENQHALCVAARKFANLMPFGCWWFLNNPSLVTEIERMRFELLGTSFIPQHSDARVLEQLIYKWEHSRRLIAAVLSAKYADLLRTGRILTRAAVERDVRLLLEQNFTTFLTR